MQLSKYLMICSSLLLTSGCSILNPVPKIVTKTEYVQKNIPLQAHPKPLVLNTVTWTVVTKDNLQEFMSTQTDPVVFYAINVKDYEVLAMNLAEITRYIQQQKAIIVYYENSVTLSKETKDGK